MISKQTRIHSSGYTRSNTCEWPCEICELVEKIEKYTWVHRLFIQTQSFDGLVCVVRCCIGFCQQLLSIDTIGAGHSGHHEHR